MTENQSNAPQGAPGSISAVGNAIRNFPNTTKIIFSGLVGAILLDSVNIYNSNGSSQTERERNSIEREKYIQSIVEYIDAKYDAKINLIQFIFSY